MSVYPILVQISRSGSCGMAAFDTQLPNALASVMDRDEFASSIRQCNENMTQNFAIIGRFVSLCGLLCFLSNFITPFVVPDIFATFWILPVCGFGGIILIVIGQIISRRLACHPTVDPLTINNINRWYNSEERAVKRNRGNRAIRWSCISVVTNVSIEIRVEGVPVIAPAAAAPARVASPSYPVAVQQFQPYYPQQELQQPPSAPYSLPMSQPPVVFHSPPSYPPEGAPPAYGPDEPAVHSTEEGTYGGTEGEGQVRSAAQFCSRCGRKRIRAEDKFCSGCGVPFAQ